MISSVAHRVTHNGKSIGEVRGKWELQVQFRPNEADAFSDKLNYKKKIIRKATATEKVE